MVIKGTHTYWSVKQLLKASQYADCLAEGHFVHSFLGPLLVPSVPHPVAGIVKECYPLNGRVYLQVLIEGQQFEAADSAGDGYEFSQARGVLTSDTTGSPYGDVGIFAVIPIGMCQVSTGPTRSARSAQRAPSSAITFGGSDLIVLTQKGTDPVYNPAFVKDTGYYSLYGGPMANATPLKS